MGRDKKTSELTEEQLDVLLGLYCWCKQHGHHLPSPDVPTSVIAAALERKGLITCYRQYGSLSIRITRKGSRLLATEHPLETIYRLSEWIIRARSHNKQVSIVYNSRPTGEMRRAMRHMLLQLSPEQYPELLIHEVPVIKELAIRQWEVMQNEIKGETNRAAT